MKIIIIALRKVDILDEDTERDQLQVGFSTQLSEIFL